MSRFNAVGVFIYAGGFTIGMQNHFNILAHLEDGKFGVATVNDNMPQLSVYTEPKDWPLGMLRARKCHVCYANPPCAPWSSAGSRSTVKAISDRTQHHRMLAKLMVELEPEIWVWESVTQAYLGDNPGLSEYITDFAMERGFTVYHFLHDVKFMGLPQQRRRVFTVASKVEIEFQPPSGNIVTVDEALSALESPGEIPSMSYKWMKYVPLTEQGRRIRHVVMEAEGTPAPGFLIHRATPDAPSRTILGGVHVIHPTEDRFIGVNEAAALCGYPPDYTFNKAGGNYFQQIARAVTPVASNYLGLMLRLALENNVEVAKPEEWEINFLGQNQRVSNYEMLDIKRRIR